MRIAIDLDGTILNFSFSEWVSKGMDYFGSPKKGAKQALGLLIADGHEVIVHTARINEAMCNERYSINGIRCAIEDVLDEHEIRYSSIWTERGKPLADVYIDDKGIKFTNWENVIDELEKK